MANNHVVVEVAHASIGILQDIVDRIFEPLFTTKGPGCGFGLPTVYGTIKQVNGHIIVEPEVGKGTSLSQMSKFL
jgi:two-component system, cell cycle sensor histidine kinase and response regulator CckA